MTSAKFAWTLAMSLLAAPNLSSAEAPLDDVDPVATSATKTLPPGAQEIAAATKVAKQGESITIRGRVAPAKDAFVKDSAVFTLIDDSVDPSRFATGKELPDTLAGFPAGAKATVRFVATNGQPLAIGLANKAGLVAGAEVFVVGKVASASGADALVVDVTSFHVPRNPLPAGFFGAGPIEGARDISDVRAQGGLKVGDEVVLRGRIGGAVTPFVDGRAMVTVMGSRLKACNENPDDRCTKPWDVCCEPKDRIRANIATVQVVDAKGQPLRTDLKGRRELKELSDVIVRGKVASVEGGALVVNATAMNVVKP